MATYTRPIGVQFLISGLGSSVHYKVMGVDGSTLISRTNSGITEITGTALYRANVANWDTSWSGWIEWDDNNSNVLVSPFLSYDSGSGSGGGSADLENTFVEDGVNVPNALALILAKSTGMSHTENGVTVIYGANTNKPRIISIKDALGNPQQIQLFLSESE